MFAIIASAGERNPFLFHLDKFDMISLTDSAVLVSLDSKQKKGEMGEPEKKRNAEKSLRLIPNQATG